MSNLDKLSTFFKERPDVLAPVLDVIGSLRRRYGNPPVSILKTQIKIGKKGGFCWLWLPLQKPEEPTAPCFVLSFSLESPWQHPRMIGTASPYPGRYVIHIALRQANELDDAILSHLDEAFRLKYGADPESGRT